MEQATFHLDGSGRMAGNGLGSTSRMGFRQAAARLPDAWNRLRVIAERVRFGFLGKAACHPAAASIAGESSPWSAPVGLAISLAHHSGT
jgi:hypothetical protein